MFKGIAFLLRYTWKFEKRYIIYSILNQIIQGVAMLLALVLPKYIIDAITKRADFTACLQLILLLISCNFLGNFLNSFFVGKCFVLKGSVFTKFQAYMTEKLSVCDFEKLESPEFLDDKERAKKFLYANGQGFGVVMDSAFNILGKIFVFAGIVAILASLNIFLVLFFVIIILLNAKYEAKTREAYVQWDMKKAPIERKSSYLINLIEDFNFGKDIRIFGLSKWIVEKVKYYLNESNEFYKKQVGETIKANYFSTFSNAILEGVAYIIFAGKALAGSISVGSFSMYVNAMIRFSGAMQDVMRSIIDIKQFSGYYEALDKYMNVPSVRTSGKNIPAKMGFKEIVFDNVSFKYPGQENYSIRNLSLRVKAGDKIAIVGENGAGKTTFIKLICRLYKPTEGTIKIDGTDINDIEYESYMELIGPVFQDYRLFSFSIKDNICFDKKERDDKVYELLCESGLKNKMDALENGIYTSVYKNFDESGFEPSGGESQKIALARAVYKNSPIVILDEPTSALDPRAEFELYQRFHTMVEGKTAFFISHRMSSCKFCDTILFFKQGEIVESGNHKKLMENKQQYFELFNMQAQFYANEM